MSTNQTISQTTRDREPTLHDVLGAVNTLQGAIGQLSADVKTDLKSTADQLRTEFKADIKSSIDQLAQSVKVGFDENSERFTKIDTEMTGMKGEMTDMKSEITHIKSVMVTKDYLDDKLYNLKGDLITLTRKEDHKVVALTKELLHNRVISEESAKRILALESFPQ